MLSFLSGNLSKEPPVVTVAVVGAGARGRVYARELTLRCGANQTAKIVAVAEPNQVRRTQFVGQFSVPSTGVFEDWRALAAQPTRLADAVLICVQDSLHAEVCVALVRQGYHVLLEKPMAVSVADCLAINKAVEEARVLLAVCHVLRYSPVNVQIKQIIDSGVLGEVSNIQHLEPVGFYHFAHSYVRGNWRNEGQSTFSLMAKSCHDIDLLTYFMGEEKNPCLRVSSFGSLNHFKKAKKPKEARQATRCLDCKMEASCPYSAKKIYLDAVTRGDTGWPATAVVDVVDIENISRALQTGPYGRCVYDGDNDVVDNQVVNLEFHNGATATFTMIAFSEAICQRKTTIFGTLGELTCDGARISVFNFLTGKKAFYEPELDPGLAGHGGGDSKLVQAFVQSVAHPEKSVILSGPQQSLESHLLVFACEESRKTGKVVDFANFKARHARETA